MKLLSLIFIFCLMSTTKSHAGAMTNHYQKNSLRCIRQVLEQGRGLENAVDFTLAKLSEVTQNKDNWRKLRKITKECKSFKRKHKKGTASSREITKMIMTKKELRKYNLELYFVARDFAAPRYNCKLTRAGLRIGLMLALGAGAQIGYCKGNNGLTRVFANPQIYYGEGVGAIATGDYSTHQNIEIENVEEIGLVSKVIVASVYKRDPSWSDKYSNVEVGLGMMGTSQKSLFSKGIKVRFNHRKIMKRLLLKK